MLQIEEYNYVEFKEYYIIITNHQLVSDDTRPCHRLDL